MLSSVTRLGVAVSGGADSVVLLHILQALLEETAVSLTVLHVNHQLRGAESDGDEAFVRSLAASLGLPVLATSASLPAGNIEQQARRARQQFFEFCRHEHGLNRIALGHTSSDQAETVLLRLFRGSGLTGLAAMAPVTGIGLIRPLLFTSREEVRRFAVTANLSWQEDRSNTDIHFRRNLVRLQTLPLLARDYNPALEKVLSRMASVARDEENYWATRIRKLRRQFVQSTPAGLILSIEKLSRLHISQQRRLLRLCLAEVRKDLRSIDISHIDGILKICASRHGHDRLMVPGVDAIRSFETLLLTTPDTMKQSRDYQMNVPLGVTIQLPFQMGTLLVNPMTSEEQNCVKVKNTAGIISEDVHLNRQVLNALQPGEFLQLRNWEPGDRLQQSGTSSPEKIKTMFHESKVLLWERRHWPVLVANGEIVWVRKFGADKKFCPAAGETSMLHIRFEPTV